ncbi:hypothetical protein AAY473_003211 [Plecturocebus cupreus]
MARELEALPGLRFHMFTVISQHLRYLSLPQTGGGSVKDKPRERKRRCAYQVRALSLAPPASRSSRASCALVAALAAAGALVSAMEARVTAGRTAAGPAAVALALSRQRREHVPRSGRRSWKRSAGVASTPAARGGGGQNGQGKDSVGEYES